MIKKAVFENDLIVGMQRELRGIDKKEAMANLDTAGGYLHSAMEIFEEAGLTVQAEQVLSILQKIAGKHKPIQEMPNLQVFFDSGKFSEEDLRQAMAGDTESLAKINVAMHEHGMSDNKIAEFLGKFYMPYHMAKKLLERGHISGLKNYQIPSPKPGSEISLTPVSPQAPAPEAKEMGNQEISMKSLLAFVGDELGLTKTADDNQDAKGKPHKPKSPLKVHDPHTSGLTSEKMIENLKHHGIVFNLADDGKADQLLDTDLSDDNDLEVFDGDDEHKSFEDES